MHWRGVLRLHMDRGRALRLRVGGQCQSRRAERERYGGQRDREARHKTFLVSDWTRGDRLKTLQHGDNARHYGRVPAS
jgi:hypothetical protein